MPRETFETIISELDHEEDWRRMRATSTCMKGGPKAVEAIIQAIGHGTTHYKIEAIRMLARLGDPRAGLALAGLMKDEDDEVRQATMDALEHLAGVLDEPTAAALLEHLKDDRIQERVTALLGVIPTSIGPLSERLRDPDESIRERAAEILANLLDPRSADAFVDAMADPNLRDLATDTLRKLGAIRDRIEQLLDDLRAVEESELKEGVRQETVIQLHRIGRPAVEILLEYLDDDEWIVRSSPVDRLVAARSKTESLRPPRKPQDRRKHPHDGAARDRRPLADPLGHEAQDDRTDGENTDRGAEEPEGPAARFVFDGGGDERDLHRDETPDPEPAEDQGEEGDGIEIHQREHGQRGEGGC